MIPVGGRLGGFTGVAVEVGAGDPTAVVMVLAGLVTAGNIGSPRRQRRQGQGSVVVVTGRLEGAEAGQRASVLSCHHPIQRACRVFPAPTAGHRLLVVAVATPAQTGAGGHARGPSR